MSNERLTPGSPSRVSDQAYDAIRDAIVQLKLWPGSAWDEKSIAQEMGMGRTPVREALLRLAMEGLVTILPRRGLLIPAIGFPEIQAVYEARTPIECGIARLAAVRVDQHDLNAIAELIEEAEVIDPEGAFERYVSMDQMIHRRLAAMSHNPFLIDAAGRILDHNERFWRYYFREHAGADAIVSHKALLSALKAHDADAAELAMREHVDASRALLHATFR